jgi:hypothetical protein
MRGNLSCFRAEDPVLIVNGLMYIPNLACPQPGSNSTDTVPLRARVDEA